MDKNAAMTTPTPPIRTRSTRVIPFVGALAFAVVFTELLLRLYGLHHPVLYEADAAAGFSLKPNQQVEMLTGTVAINEWGLRDDRAIASGETNAFRVLVLGDSVAWGGLRIPQNELLTARVERLLSGEAEILNGSVNGSSIVQMVRRYQQRWRDLHPDLIVVYTIPTSFQRPPIVELTGDSLAFPTKQPRFALGVAIELGRTALGAYPGLAWLQPKPAAQTRAAGTPETNLDAAIEALVELQEGTPTPLKILLSPTRMDDHRLREKITARLDEHRLPYTDLNGTVPPEDTYYVDSVHFSPAGHEAAAPIVAEIVRELLRTENK
jgi:lysophospholipase L1-like esterase